jgi:DNA repair protein RecO (recombination protein O)
VFVAREQMLDALVLRCRDYKENDKLVTVFSATEGRETLLARGARKPDGSLRAVSQPFSRISLQKAAGRGSLNILTQGEVQEPFLPLKADLDKIAYAAYLSELVIIGMPEYKPQPQVFAALLAAWSMLDFSDKHTLAARFFELRLLDALGLRPRLDGCQSCGRSLEGGSFYLSAARGGIICRSCRGSEAGLISAGTVRNMQRLLDAPFAKVPQLSISDTMLAEMEQALAPYLRYYLEGSGKAREFLRRLNAEPQ